MTPIQQMLLGVGASEKTYLDDVFSTFLYEGGTGDKTINNGIDMTKGGMFWSKNRTSDTYGGIWDTERGVTKRLRPDSNIEEATAANLVKSFNSNGVTISDDGGTQIYETGEQHASWTFRKAPGFFDIVTWDGNGVSGRQIAHNLGCVPGLIMIKATTNAYAMSDRNWQVYHRDMDVNKAIYLDTTGATVSSDAFGGVRPTATHFTVSLNYPVNYSGASYVAYLFAGGKGATDNAVDFDGDDRLIIASTADLSPNDQDFTWEAWINPDSWGSSYDSIYYNEPGGAGGLWIGGYNGNFVLRTGGTTNHISETAPSTGKWTHVAVTRKGSVARLFYNGEEKASATVNTNFLTGATYIGDDAGGSTFDGKVSNMRFIKGQSLYNQEFNAIQEPLTTTSQYANSSNVKLLCCNGTSATSATVTPSSITTNGNPTASSNNSIFNDTAGYVFGEGGDQDIIKCGFYKGNGSNDGTEIHLGWEPQWFMVKRASSAENWLMLDTMRGWANQGGNTGDIYLTANQHLNEAEYDFAHVRSRSIKMIVSEGHTNSNDEEYLYMAIRRPDGYVGKPVTAGTEVFSINSGSASGAPLFDSTHVVDFQFVRGITTTANWETGARLLGTKQVYLNSSGAETNIDAAGWKYHYMDGWHTNASGINNYMCWMFKRHAGFDVVTYVSDGVRGRSIPHSLNAVPEMIWIKLRGGNQEWVVYHKGLNGGTNPEQYYLRLDTSGAEASASVVRFNNTAPTSTHFTVGEDNAVNSSTTHNYIAMLFASVDGISKCGFYDGSSSSQTITTGFQPRFVIIKDRTGSGNWFVLDTTRGWGSGNDQYLTLDDSAAQAATDFGVPTSTGFTLYSGGGYNANGASYVYYAHA